MSANTNKAGLVYPSRTKEARHAAYVARRDVTPVDKGARLVPGRMTEPMRSGVQCRPAIDLLPAARANGVRRHVRGLTALLARSEPIERSGALVTRGQTITIERSGALVTRGQTITIEPRGRTLTPDEAARLLDFATAYFEGSGAT